MSTKDDKNYSFRDLDQREWFTPEEFDAGVNQGRPTETAWRTCDAICVALFAGCVAAIVFQLLPREWLRWVAGLFGGWV